MAMDPLASSPVIPRAIMQTRPPARQASLKSPRNEPLWAYLSYRPTIGGAENAA